MDFKLKSSRKRRWTKRIPKYTPCGYCFSQWATVWDHIIPFSYGGRTIDDNLYPSCRACNAIASDKVFDSIEEKRNYIMKHRHQDRKVDIEQNKVA